MAGVCKKAFSRVHILCAAVNLLLSFLVLIAPRCSTANENASPKLREFSFPPEVSLGEEILVSCVVKKGTSGPHDLTWLKDGQKLGTGHRVSVSAQSKSSATLRIASLQPEDVGNYTCVARNTVGSASFTAPLVVHGNLYRKYLVGSARRTKSLEKL